MPLKDLSGKTVYDLEPEDFEKLFCSQCKDSNICVKDPKTVNVCMQLINNGVWDSHFRKRVHCQLIECPYCRSRFPKRGDGLQKCPGCGSELIF